VGGPEIFFLSDSEFKTDISFRKRNFLSFASFDGGNFTGDTNIKTFMVSPQIILKEPLWGLDNRLIAGFDYTDADEDITNRSLFFGSLSTGIFELKKKNSAIISTMKSGRGKKFQFPADIGMTGQNFHLVRAPRTARQWMKTFLR
jgi:hypothetical protein